MVSLLSGDSWGDTEAPGCTPRQHLAETKKDVLSAHRRPQTNSCVSFYVKLTGFIQIYRKYIFLINSVSSFKHISFILEWQVLRTLYSIRFNAKKEKNTEVITVIPTCITINASHFGGMIDFGTSDLQKCFIRLN